MSDLKTLADLGFTDLKDLRKTVTITVVIPSRKSDVRILIAWGPKLYSTVVSLL